MLKRKFILKLISNSSTIREKLSFKEHLILYKVVSELDELNIDKLFIKIHENTDYPKTNPKTQRIITAGLTVSSLAVPIPGLVVAIGYLTDLNVYKCRIHCERNTEDGDTRQSCYKNCKYEAIKWASKFIEKELKSCPKTKKPKKCRKKLYKLLINWKQKEVEASIRLKTQKRYPIRK